MSLAGFLPTSASSTPGNANVHAFVRHYLAGSKDADACLAANQLADLQAARNRADYDLARADVGTRSYAMVTVERAHRVVSAVEKCRRGNVVELIRQAIADYKRRVQIR